MAKFWCELTLHVVMLVAFDPTAVDHLPFTIIVHIAAKLFTESGFGFAELIRKRGGPPK